MEPKPLSLRSDGGRPRKKKIEQLVMINGASHSLQFIVLYSFFLQDSDGEGGYTITHDEDGCAILTKVYKEQSKASKSKKGPQNEHHRLVYCHKFSDLRKVSFFKYQWRSK